jgi:hypothetical protein
VANASAETYFQDKPVKSSVANFGNSCMQCHFGAASADFSWTLMNEAWSPQGPNALMVGNAMLVNTKQKLTPRQKQILELRRALANTFPTPATQPKKALPPSKKK